uniref:Multidrug and toxin extrusion protein 1 n=1 Tax=Aegilops tauschii TaxID=37682 RepID=N1R058_AEGTA
MHRVLVATGQDPEIASTAYAYILCSLPDLAVQSFLHPLRIYLRAQSVTLPLTYAAAAAVLLHVPINFVLVDVLGLGIRGVALGAVCTNLNFLLFIVAYVCFFGMYGHDEGETKASVAAAEEEGAKEWWTLVRLSVHSCMSVCLEWWWYEIMVLLCGVLADPKAAVAAMGVLIQTTSLIYIFPHSLGCAVSTRVGHELGARRPERARLVARVGLGLGAVLGLRACGIRGCRLINDLGLNFHHLACAKVKLSVSLAAETRRIASLLAPSFLGKSPLSLDNAVPVLHGVHSPYCCTDKLPNMQCHSPRVAVR